MQCLFVQVSKVEDFQKIFNNPPLPPPAKDFEYRDPSFDSWLRGVRILSARILLPKLHSPNVRWEIALTSIFPLLSEIDLARVPDPATRRRAPDAEEPASPEVAHPVVDRTVKLLGRREVHEPPSAALRDDVSQEAPRVEAVLSPGAPHHARKVRVVRQDLQVVGSLFGVQVQVEQIPVLCFFFDHRLDDRPKELGRGHSVIFLLGERRVRIDQFQGLGIVGVTLQGLWSRGRPHLPLLAKD